MGKTKLAFALFFVSIFFVHLTAQELEKKTAKYRRSSLHTMIIESATFPQKETVVKSFYEAPFPDKYDEHNFGEKSINPVPYALTAEEKKGLVKSTSAGGDLVGKFGAGALTAFAASQGIALDPETFKIDRSLLPEEVPVIIKKYLADKKVAHKMVSKWYNRKEDGSMDMELIFNRGLYNASEKEASIAKKSSEGNQLLKDAGIYLLGNTFLVVNRFNFLKNEIPANLTRLASRMVTSKLSSPFDLIGQKAADLAYVAASVGYSVSATSYLYKLKWNDSIQSVFDETLYVDKNSMNPEKIAAFDKSNLFQLEYIGTETASSLVMLDLTKPGRTQSEIIQTATVRTVDAVYLKLQKTYDVFMPQTALYTGGDGAPITAKIGMKEGLVGGEKFDVFEQVIDPKTKLTKYEKVGRIKVDKNLVWDNRYNAVTEIKKDSITGLAPVALDRTTFIGGKKMYAGLLIKQVK